MSLPDYDPATYKGTPSIYRVGDRVRVSERCGYCAGYEGTVVRFKVHAVGEERYYFLMPVLSLDRRSRDGEMETFYPFSVEPLVPIDPVTALSRLARPA